MKRRILIIILMIKIFLFSSYIFPQVSEGGEGENDLISQIIEQREVIVNQRNFYKEEIMGLIGYLNVFDSKEIKLSNNDRIEVDGIYVSLLISFLVMETFLEETEGKKHYFSQKNLSSYSAEEQSEILYKLKAQFREEKRLKEEIKKTRKQIDCLHKKYFRPI